MKIYHIGLFDNSEPILALRKALSSHCKAGDYRETSYVNYKAIHKNEPKDRFEALFAHDVIVQLEELDPDIVFVHVQADTLSDRLLQYLKDCRSFVIGFTGDVRYPIPAFYLKHGQYFDLSLFTNMNDVVTCREVGINADFIHVGYDDTIYTPEGKKYDNFPEIIFMGNNYGADFPLSAERASMVKLLHNTFGNKFRVFGQGWGDIIPDTFSLMFNHEEEASAYRSCKIAINYSHFNYDRYSSDRLNRIMGCGAFCLSHHYKGIETDFLVGLELETFKDHDELLEKINLYLVNENLKKISRNGNEKISKKYTYRNFAERIIEFYNSKKGN